MYFAVASAFIIVGIVLRAVAFIFAGGFLLILAALVVAIEMAIRVATGGYSRHLWPPSGRAAVLTGGSSDAESEVPRATQV